MVPSVPKPGEFISCLVVWGLASLVTAAPVGGQVAAGARTVEAHLGPPARHAERWFADVPVGGGLRVGLMLRPTEAERLPELFFAWIPGGSDGLCVQVASKDGRYSGEFWYELDPAISGVVSLEWTTAHKRALADYSTRELAILSRLSSDCGLEEGRYVISSWTPKAVPGRTVVLVNSDYPTSLIAVDDGRVFAEEDCQPVAGVTRAFNLSCELPREWWSEPNHEIYVRIAEPSGRRIRPRDLPLRVLVP